MLTPLLPPIIIDLPKLQNSEEPRVLKLNDQNEPVSTFDQKDELRLKAAIASSQHFKTFSWL